MGAVCTVAAASTARARSLAENYRSSNGERNAPNKRMVVGGASRVAPDHARRLAQELLGRVGAGDDSAGERTKARIDQLIGSCVPVMTVAHDLQGETRLRILYNPPLHRRLWILRRSSRRALPPAYHHPS